VFLPASYQAVSGQRLRGPIDELRQQVKRRPRQRSTMEGGREPGDHRGGSANGRRGGKRVDQLTSQIYPHPIAFNVSATRPIRFLDSGYTKEEMKMQNEGRKNSCICRSSGLQSHACVCPFYRAHSVAVSAEFNRPISVERAREVLAKSAGRSTLVDEPQNNRLPNCH